MLTEDDVREIVNDLLAKRSQKDLADDLGVSPAYLNDYIHFRREPGPKLLEGLGLCRVNMYMRITSKEKS